MEIPFPTSRERIPLSNGGMLVNISAIAVVVNSKIGGNRGLFDRLLPGQLDIVLHKYPYTGLPAWRWRLFFTTGLES